VISEFFILALLSALSMAALWRALPKALSNPCGFPSARWGWPEGMLAGGLVALFLAMGAGSSGRPVSKLGLEDVLRAGALYGGLVFFVLGFLVFRGFDLVRTFGLRSGGWNLWTVLGWLLIILPPIFLVQALIYAWAGPEQSLQPIVEFLLESPGLRERAAVSAIAVIAAPVTEELIFRGCLYGVVRAQWGRTAALVVTSVLFALIHWHAPALPGLTLVGLGLALVYERCGSLWAPIAMHAAFNAFNIVAALTWPDFVK
jgi:membrane protease YdiL (CAAX protease family)